MSAEYVELNRSFITRHRGGRVHEHMYDGASVWLSDQEAPHPSLCSDTNLASATLWLLFKLACTQGSTVPVNIKSWHNSMKQPQQDVIKKEKKKKNYLGNERQKWFEWCILRSYFFPLVNSFPMSLRSQLILSTFFNTVCSCSDLWSDLEQNRWWSKVCFGVATLSVPACTPQKQRRWLMSHSRLQNSSPQYSVWDQLRWVNASNTSSLHTCIESF